VVPVYEIRDLEIGTLSLSDDALLLEHAALGWGILRHKVCVFDNTEQTLFLADFVRL
jgi:hypothetical protein